MIFAARKSVAKLLPPLVVLWLAFAVLGGVVFLPQHAGLDAEGAGEAGLGLCAATAAVLFVAVARRPLRPAPAAHPARSGAAPLSVRPALWAAPRPPTVPLRQTLQVFLN